MSTKTIAFFGASTGVGLAALKHTLAAGHQCIALCRTPSKLERIFPAEATPNLQIITGNAHDLTSVRNCLQTANGTLVDTVVTTIGSPPILSKLTIEDPEVCQKGATILLKAIAQLRREGITGNPRIIACSTTGVSSFGRDIPVVMLPVYGALARIPHADKKAMEECFVGGGESFTVVRPSMLGDGESKKTIRVGVEDPWSGRESTAIGYNISREDAGRWVAENLVLRAGERFLNKMVSITN